MRSGGKYWSSATLEEVINAVDVDHRFTHQRFRLSPEVVETCSGLTCQTVIVDPFYISISLRLKLLYFRLYLSFTPFY